MKDRRNESLARVWDNAVPLFSVIVPTCNRHGLLSKCLNALAPGMQTLNSDAYEVIVSDDGRNNYSKEMIQDRYPWVRYVQGLSKGPAANRNNGAGFARGEWLVFIDDDCMADEGWLEGYYEFQIKKKEVKILEGKTYAAEGRKSLSNIAPLNIAGGYLWACNFAMKAEVFKVLGGFNEVFPFAAMEDVDLRTRIVKAGYDFQFVPEASVHHPWRKRGGWKTHKESHQSVLLYLSLHPEEFSDINSSFYFEKILREFLKVTLPGMLRYQCKGLGSAFIAHLADVRMFFILLFKSSVK